MSVPCKVVAIICKRKLGQGMLRWNTVEEAAEWGLWVPLWVRRELGYETPALWEVMAEVPSTNFAIFSASRPAEKALRWDCQSAMLKLVCATTSLWDLFPEAGIAQW